MGKVSQFIRALRSRFAHFRSKQSNDESTSRTITPTTPSQQSTTYPSSTSSPQHGPSNKHTSPNPVPKVQPSASSSQPDNNATYLARFSANIIAPQTPIHHTIHDAGLGPHAALDTNFAVSNFARRLPLDELSSIGSSSPSSAASSPTRERYRDNSIGAKGREREAQGSTAQARRLSLASASTASSWSFACRSARRREREEDEDDGEFSSLGRIAGWGMAGQASGSSSTAIPETDTSSLNSQSKSSLHLREAPQVSAKFSASAYDLFPESDLHNDDMPGRPMMSDATFAALPNWSDVEDDPEYDSGGDQPAFCWSTTASSCLMDTLGDVSRMITPLLVVNVLLGEPGYEEKEGNVREVLGKRGLESGDEDVVVVKKRRVEEGVGKK